MYAGNVSLLTFCEPVPTRSLGAHEVPFFGYMNKELSHLELSGDVAPLLSTLEILTHYCRH